MISHNNHKTLNEIELFNDKTIGNVPFHLFIVTCFIAFFSFYQSFLLGFLLSITLIPGIFYLHRNDPQALTVYLKSKSLPAQINHRIYKETSIRRCA